MDVETALINYGLEKKEISIYLFLLRHGAQTAHAVSKGTGILRQTVYDAISNLQHKGLVSEITQNQKKHFMAEPPKALIGALREKEDAIKRILPELDSIKDSYKVLTNAKLFNGLKGIKTLYEDFLSSKGEIKTIQPDIPEKFLQEYFVENFSIRRVKNKTPIKIIKERISTEFQKKIDTDMEKFREVRVNTALKGFDAHFVLYGRKIAMIDYRDTPVAVLVENEFFAKSFDTLFNRLWTDSKIY